MTSAAAPLASGGSERKSPDWWLEAVLDQERRGELLAAFDLAERGLSEYPDDVRLKHRAVLALARTGATAEAARADRGSPPRSRQPRLRYARTAFSSFCASPCATAPAGASTAV